MDAEELRAHVQANELLLQILMQLVLRSSPELGPLMVDCIETVAKADPRLSRVPPAALALAKARLKSLMDPPRPN